MNNQLKDVLTLPEIDASIRRHHLYLCGGTSATRLWVTLGLALDDIWEGRGLLLLDMDGRATSLLLDAIPKRLAQDTLVWDLADRKRHVGFNIIDNILPDDRPRAAEGIVEVFQSVFGRDGVGHRSSDILRMALLSLMDAPGTSLYCLAPLFENAAYRAYIQRHTRNRRARSFWQHEWAAWEKSRDLANVIAPLKNKLSPFFTNPLVRNVLASRTTLDLPFCLLASKLLLVHLARQTIGTSQATLLGSLILSQLATAARGTSPPADCNVYLSDPFEPAILAELLSDTASGVNLTLSSPAAHDRQALFDACGSFAAFKCGAKDVALLESEIGDLAFEKRKIMEHLTLSPDALCLRYFGGLPQHSRSEPRTYPYQGQAESIMRYCRQRYTKARGRIERKLHRFHSCWEKE